MAFLNSYGKIITARTECAQYVLKNDGILKRYIENFGRKSDLEAIVDAGRRAEAFNSAQGQALTSGRGATADVQGAFVQLQKDYNRIMGGVSGMLGDLRRANASNELIKEVQRILKNEAALLIATLETADGKMSKANKSQAQEALRAEIWRDADALLTFHAGGGKKALEDRGITKAVLTSLKNDAGSLAGLLATRTAKKGSSKTVTQSERDAVEEQKDFWSSCYRILQATAVGYPDLQALLKQARQPKPKKKEG